MKSAFITIVRAFSPFEYVLFIAFSLILLGSILSLISYASGTFMVDTPEDGGSLTEGVIGSPRFINPLLAGSDADRDLTALIYSGLLKRKPSGELIPDLAESYTLSEDGLSYTFILRDNVSFHDGVRVTADDVIFTVQKTLDPALKSPRRASWDGVSVEKVNDRTVRFVLKQPYSPFLENVTLGILPEHFWRNANTEQFQFSTGNIDPIGSGPYKVTEIKRNSSGIPLSYTLKANARYALGRPHIDTITFFFYQNEADLFKAFEKGDVESMNSVTPALLSLLAPTLRIETTSLPRIFAVFFNQNQATLFKQQEVRAALEHAVLKERIVKEILSGYGTPIDSPIPPGIFGPKGNDEITEAEVAEEMELESASEESASEKGANTTEEIGVEEGENLPAHIKEARDILLRNGWEYSEEERRWTKETKKEDYTLSFSLATSNAPELKAVAEMVAEDWRALGADVTLQVYETGDLNQNIIRQRKYDALLFGEVVGRELDLFAFWHSSQRNDPGLNVALYANISADKYLEDARTESDQAIREEKYRAFEGEVKSDVPAVFLYSPFFIYVVPKEIKGLSLGSITTPAERFLNVHEWYVETNRIWKLFE